MKQNQPWPNGVASRSKLKTWIYLRLCLARACMHLRWLAFTLVEIKSACKLKHVFHHLATQPKSTQVEWCPLTYIVLLANWKKFRICLLWNGLFGTCVYLWGNLQVCLATQRKSLRKFSLCPPATTCRSIWPGLKGVCPSFLLLLNGIL